MNDEGWLFSWRTGADKTLQLFPEGELQPALSIMETKVILHESTYAFPFCQLVEAAGGKPQDKQAPIPGPVAEFPETSTKKIGVVPIMPSHGVYKTPNVSSEGLRPSPYPEKGNPLIRMGKTRRTKYAIDGSTLNFGSCHVIYRGWKGTISQANAFLSRTWQAVDFKNAGSTIVYGIAPGVKLNFYPGEGIFSLTGKNEIRDRYLPQIHEWLNGNPSSPLSKCDPSSLNSKTGQQIKTPSTYASPTKLSVPLRKLNMTLLEASQHIPKGNSNQHYR